MWDREQYVACLGKFVSSFACRPFVSETLESISIPNAVKPHRDVLCKCRILRDTRDKTLRLFLSWAGCCSTIQVRLMIPGLVDGLYQCKVFLHKMVVVTRSSVELHPQELWTGGFEVSDVGFT